MSDAEDNEFCDGYALDEQEGANGAEDAQCTFHLAPQWNGNAPVTILMS
jgi:hypothetical protein